MFGDLLPYEVTNPRLLQGQAVFLEEREILTVDLPVCETVHATAFHVPSARTLIAGDLPFSKYHLYMGDTNNPPRGSGRSSTHAASGRSTSSFPATASPEASNCATRRCAG